MYIGNNDVVKVYGQYRMKLTPYIVLKDNKEVDNEKSTAQVTMYDISQNFDMLWSTTLPIREAHAALTIFEGIGYYPLADMM